MIHEMQDQRLEVAVVTVSATPWPSPLTTILSITVNRMDSIQGLQAILICLAVTENEISNNLSLNPKMVFFQFPTCTK